MFLITTPWNNWFQWFSVARERDMQYTCDRLLSVWPLTKKTCSPLVNKTPFFANSECCFCLGMYLFSMRCGKMIKSRYYCGLPLHGNFYLWASGTEKYSARLLCHHPNGECVLMPNLHIYRSLSTVVVQLKKIAICSLILWLSSKM